MGRFLTQNCSHSFVLLLHILIPLLITGPCPALGVALGLGEHILPSPPATAITLKKLVKRPHGQGWRGSTGFFFESQRTRQCLPAFGTLPMDDCLRVITEKLPAADEVKRQWWHKASSRAIDKPNVQMPVEQTFGQCTLKITPLYPITTVAGDNTVMDSDTATWRQIRNIATALTHGCPGGETGYGGFQQAGDHGALMISIYDKDKANVDKRRQAELEMLRALSNDPELTMADFDRMIREYRVSGLGNSRASSCSSGGRVRGGKTCATDNTSAECSDAYSIDASNCCLGYTFSEKPISSALSNLLLGFKSIAASTLSSGESAIGWCDPIWRSSYSR